MEDEAKNSEYMEGVYREVCNKKGDMKNDYCVTQYEDNNHDEINSKEENSFKCNEDKILGSIVDLVALKNFKLVAVEKNSLAKKGTKLPYFYEFIKRTMGFCSSLLGRITLQEMLDIKDDDLKPKKSTHPARGASIDTIFNPYSNMFKEAFHNNVFDSADLGHNSVDLKFNDISNNGKKQHYWDHLLDEMFFYCKYKTADKEFIETYLRVSLKFDDTVTKKKSHINVTLTNINKKFEYVISNAAIRKILYPKEQFATGASQKALNFLKALNDDFKEYCKGYLDDNDVKRLYSKICKFLKYSGDQATIKEMELRINDPLVLISRDRNLISRSTLDERVDKYTCPYMDSFRRNLKFNLMLNKLAISMMHDELIGTPKKDMIKNIKDSKSHIQDKYDFLVVYINNDEGYTFDEIDHLKSRGYLDDNNNITPKIINEMNEALDRLIVHFNNYFKIKRSDRPNSRQPDEVVLNKNDNPTISSFMENYKNDTALGIALIKDVMCILDLLKENDKALDLKMYPAILTKAKRLFSMLTKRGFTNEKFVFVPKKSSQQDYILKIPTIKTGMKNGIKTTEISAGENLFEIIDNAGNLKNIKILKLTKELFNEVLSMMKWLGVKFFNDEQDGGTKMSRYRMSRNINTKQARKRRINTRKNSKQSIKSETGVENFLPYNFSSEITNDFMTYVSLKLRREQDIRSKYVSFKYYDLQDYGNANVKRFYEEYDSANALVTNFLIYVMKKSNIITSDIPVTNDPESSSDEFSSVSSDEFSSVSSDGSSLSSSRSR